ncbi:uncharacterized protein FA14DRAFT_158438 [Meira miltonrushii]|uniref:Uncharacterized protein n=1 Tax=Meira miltonrushii TaxID=1280837 RepID=A0A316V251_9BASI|nr:uncharacterized protein FA14DRAFT_158438 [Meira miltonrushii]PWN31626.1 hypothetical protein FA14DRAFT_158438 [Meira miltonrushii]
MLLFYSFFVFVLSLCSLHHAWPVGQEIDLNQPASPDNEEEWPTTDMMTTNAQISPTQNADAPIKAKERPKRNKEKANEASKRYYQRKKNGPNYAEYLRLKREYKHRRFQNLPEERKNEERLKTSSTTKAYIKRKKEEDPDFRQKDSRTLLRKRIFEGTATDEDKTKYRILCDKVTAAVKKHHLLKGKRQQAPSSIDNKRAKKKRRINEKQQDP